MGPKELAGPPLPPPAPNPPIPEPVAPKPPVPAANATAANDDAPLRWRRDTLLRFLGSLTLVALALGMAFGGGIATARLAVEGPSPFGRIALGPWIASPLAGHPDADPYTRVGTALTATLPLGQAEGLVFRAVTDSQDRPLVTGCDYRIEGLMPPARWWTLVPTLPETRPSRPGRLHSRGLVRGRAGEFEINIGTGVQPGNWLALPEGASRPFALVATLYDTPVTRETDLGSTTMPPIVRGTCRTEARS